MSDEDKPKSETRKKTPESVKLTRLEITQHQNKKSNSTKTVQDADDLKPSNKAQLMVDKDIVISPKGEKDTAVPLPMMTPHHLQSANTSSESLPVYTQKHWKPNESAVPDLLFKENATLARIKQPGNVTLDLLNSTKEQVSEVLVLHQNSSQVQINTTDVIKPKISIAVNKDLVKQTEDTFDWGEDAQSPDWYESKVQRTPLLLQTNQNLTLANNETSTPKVLSANETN